MEETILKASNNHWTLNISNIFSISKDLWNLIQSDIKNRAYQVQRLLADELDEYKERENVYVDENIKKIQELYKVEDNGEMKRERKSKMIRFYYINHIRCWRNPA